MRVAVSALSKFILSGVLAAALIAACSAEEGLPEADVQPNMRRDWHHLANGRTEFEISDPALLPSQLALAIEQSSCRYKDEIKQLPVHFFSIDRLHLATVFYRSGVIGSHQLFDLTERRPRLVEFSVLSQPNGFVATSQPGVITWRKEAGVFQAETGSDVCPSARLRHVYRLGEGRNKAILAIVRVEIQYDGCGQGEWTTIWNAPQWSERLSPNVAKPVKDGD